MSDTEVVISEGSIEAIAIATEAIQGEKQRNKGQKPLPVSSDSSDSESSEAAIAVNGGTDSSSSAPAPNNGVNDTESEEEEEVRVVSSSGFTRDGEPDFTPKKAVAEIDSSDTESDEKEERGEEEEKEEDEAAVMSDEEEIPVAKEEEEDDDEEEEIEDVKDGCIASKAVEEEDEKEEEKEEDDDEFDLSRTPSPLAHSPSPPMMRRTSPAMSSLKAASPPPAPRSPSPERKDSRGSHGSSSYDEERASSLSPEPTKAIVTPSPKVTSPSSPPSSQSKSALTKIYTDSLGDSDNEEKVEKAVRARPASDITQIYTQKLQQAEEAGSPKPERKDLKFSRPAGMKDITQLYTAAFKEEEKTLGGEKVKPFRNGNIAKLYQPAGENKGAFKGKPNDELTNPKKHNMATSIDKEAIQEAYTNVMADKNGVEWAAFTFDGTVLGVTATGDDFVAFKSHFGPDDRGFGYIKIMTGDEMSKRSKFVFCTWVGPNVSVMKKAKMSTDKALMKEIIQNLSVELQIETAGEFSLEHFKAEVDKAGGARYGTGVRDL